MDRNLFKCFIDLAGEVGLEYNICPDAFTFEVIWGIIGKGCTVLIRKKYLEQIQNVGKYFQQSPFPYIPYSQYFRSRMEKKNIKIPTNIIIEKKKIAWETKS